MKHAANILGDALAEPKAADFRKFSHLIVPGRIVTVLDGTKYRVASMVSGPTGVKVKLANLQGESIPTPADFHPINVTMAHFGAWMRFHVAYNKDFDRYVKSYIQKAGLPVDDKMNWSSWLASTIGRHLKGDDDLKDEAIHFGVLKALEDRNVLANFQNAIKKFPDKVQKEPLARQVSHFLWQTFIWMRDRGDFQEYINKMQPEQEVSMQDEGTDEGEETNILETEQYATPSRAGDVEADLDVEKFKEDFGKWLVKKYGQNEQAYTTAGQYLFLFDMIWESVMSHGTKPKRNEMLPQWEKETGLSLGSLKAYLGDLAGLISSFVRERGDYYEDSNVFINLVRNMTETKPKGVPARASSLHLAEGIDGDVAEANKETVAPITLSAAEKEATPAGDLISKMPQRGKPKSPEQLGLVRKTEDQIYREQHGASKEAFFSPEDAEKFREHNQGSNVALNQDEEDYQKWEPVMVIHTEDEKTAADPDPNPATRDWQPGEWFNRNRVPQNLGQCSCEWEKCPLGHKAGGCMNPAAHLLEIFGTKTRYCQSCLEATQANLPAKDIRILSSEKVAATADDFYSQIAQYHNQHGGSTFHPKMGNLDGTDMWSVSIRKDLQVIENGAQIAPAQVKQYVESQGVQTAMNDPTSSIGTWANSGQTYFDVVQTIADRDTAIALGKEHDQIAIFNLKTHEELMLADLPEKEAASKPLADEWRLVLGENGYHPAQPTPSGDEVWRNPYNDVQIIIVTHGMNEFWAPLIDGKARSNDLSRSTASLDAYLSAYQDMDSGVKNGSTKTARLIRGDELTPEMREQVLDAFPRRWTKDNPHRAETWKECPNCDINNPFVADAAAEGHNHPVIPMIVDDEWIRNYAFNFTNDGRLKRPQHAFPLWKGQHAASINHLFAMDKQAYADDRREEIGELMRDGKTVYYAYVNGVREESEDREAVRKKLESRHPKKAAFDPQLATLLGSWVVLMLGKWLGNKWQEYFGDGSSLVQKAESILEKKGVTSLATLDSYAQQQGTDRFRAFWKLAAQQLVLSVAVTTGISAMNLLSGKGETVSQTPTQNQMTITDEVDAVPADQQAPQVDQQGPQQVNTPQGQQQVQQDQDDNPQRQVKMTSDKRATSLGPALPCCGSVTGHHKMECPVYSKNFDETLEKLYPKKADESPEEKAERLKLQRPEGYWEGLDDVSEEPQHAEEDWEIANRTHLYCPRCLECVTCNLRPCKDGGEHLPGVPEDQKWDAYRKEVEGGMLKEGDLGHDFYNAIRPQTMPGDTGREMHSDTTGRVRVGSDLTEPGPHSPNAPYVAPRNPSNEVSDREVSDTQAQDPVNPYSQDFSQVENNQLSSTASKEAAQSGVGAPAGGAAVPQENAQQQQQQGPMTSILLNQQDPESGSGAGEPPKQPERKHIPPELPNQRFYMASLGGLEVAKVASKQAYIYQAALVCDECARETMKQLQPPANPADEHTFDSDDYPKGPYPNGGGAADGPQHCDKCGVFLENPLTTDGNVYMQDMVDEAIRDGRGEEPHIREWMDFYGYHPDQKLPDISEEEQTDGFLSDQGHTSSQKTAQSEVLGQLLNAYTILDTVLPGAAEGAKQELRLAINYLVEGMNSQNEAEGLGPYFKFSSAKGKAVFGAFPEPGVDMEDMNAVCRGLLGMVNLWIEDTGGTPIPPDEMEAMIGSAVESTPVPSKTGAEITHHKPTNVSGKWFVLMDEGVEVWFNVFDTREEAEAQYDKYHQQYHEDEIYFGVFTTPPHLPNQGSSQVDAPQTE